MPELITAWRSSDGRVWPTQAQAEEAERTGRMLDWLWARRKELGLEDADRIRLAEALHRDWVFFPRTQP